MCSLTKSCDIQKMKVYTSLPQADAPCLRGGKSRPDWPPTGRPARENPAGHPGMPQRPTERERPTGENLRWIAGAAHPVPAGPGHRLYGEPGRREERIPPGPVHIGETGRLGPLPLKAVFRA